MNKLIRVARWASVALQVIGIGAVVLGCGGLVKEGFPFSGLRSTGFTSVVRVAPKRNPFESGQTSIFHDVVVSDLLLGVLGGLGLMAAGRSLGGLTANPPRASQHEPHAGDPPPA